MKLDPVKFAYTTFDYFKEEKVEKDSDIFQPKTDSYLKTAFDISEETFTIQENFYSNLPITKDKSDDDLETIVTADKKGRVSGLNLAKGSSENCELTLGGKVKIESITGSGKSSDTVDYGEYRIISLVHSFDEGGNYQNQFEGVPAHVEAPPHTNPNLFPVCETQSAVVTDTNDPEGMGRIRVRFYWQTSQDQSPWLRVITTRLQGQ